MKKPVIVFLVTTFPCFSGLLYAQVSATTTNDSIVNALDEIVVMAHYDHFKIKGPNKFVYEVSKDSTLRDAMTIDALRKVPVLNARNNGDVSAMDGKTLVFKINGLRDPLLSNLSQALTAIPANAIKNLEFTNRISGDGRNILEVNIVTKGRLEGYRAQITSNIADARWRNGIWGMTKSRKLTLHGSYFNTWEWGHKTASGNEEYRTQNPDLYKYETREENGGYKTDLHNFEAGISHDIDDNSFLNLYGSAMFKTDPRINSFSSTVISAKDGTKSLSYQNIGRTRMDDAEYTASLKYETKHDKHKTPWHLNIGYEFYTRPFSSVATNIFDNIDCNTNADISFLNLTNSRLQLNKSYTTNTLLGEWEYKPTNRILLELYGKLRTRHESYENTMCIIKEATPGNVSPDYSKTSLDEYFGTLTPKFLYYTHRWEIRAGAVVEAYRHKVKATGLENPMTNNKAYAFPFISWAILTNRKMLVSLSYNMDNNIPDVTALDPYVDRTTPGEISYGNPYLKPQMNHNMKFGLEGKTGKLYSGGSITASYVDNIILAYQFVNAGELNHTYGNIANRRGIGISGYTSGRLHRNTYLRVNASIEWTQYRAGLLSMRNQGWQAWVKARVEQELPWGVTLDASTSYSSRPVMLQGDGSHNFSYDLGFYKQFMNRKLMVMVDASSFIPVWFKRYSTTFAPDYHSKSWNRTFHASFSLTLRYSFGKLKSRVRENSFQIDNNDIKKSYSD